jgi:PPOX class probable F420-dependent enzyme
VTSTLDDPVAQSLLQSTNPARLAYIWPDGTPRVVPIWFHWNGTDIVMGTPADAPKVEALRRNPRVAITIDSNDFPPGVLLVRGEARLEVVEGVTDEYVASAKRYFGEQGGQDWVAQAGALVPSMVRISVRPQEVRILDFKTRFPSALARRMQPA